jgi:hypothetical protein
MENFIISLITVLIIAVIIHFGGLVGVLSALFITLIYHVYHRIKYGYWLDE